MLVVYKSNRLYLSELKAYSFSRRKRGAYWGLSRPANRMMMSVLDASMLVISLLMALEIRSK